jgi:hypothetical protein
MSRPRRSAPAPIREGTVYNEALEASIDAQIGQLGLPADFKEKALMTYHKKWYQQKRDVGAGADENYYTALQNAIDDAKKNKEYASTRKKQMQEAPGLRMQTGATALTMQAPINLGKTK